MTTAPRSVRLLALLGCFGALMAGFFITVRPWYQQWGATGDESVRPLPGDEIVVTGPGTPQETRAITIHAPIARVWPWVAQLGLDRGGFYSFDILENIVGCEMPTEDYLRPAKQTWKLGDKLWMYPQDKAGGVGFATLRVYEPGRVLAFGTRSGLASTASPEDGSWSFVLVPLDDSTTRFLVRGRGPASLSLLGVAFNRSVFEPVHFVMERRTMIGIKQLAEGSSRSRLLNHAQVALWAVTFGLFVAAIVLVFRREHWTVPLAGFIAAGLVFELLTLRQPPVGVGVALVCALGILITWPGRVAPHQIIRPTVHLTHGH